MGEDTLQRAKTIQSIRKDHFGKEEVERIDLDASEGQTGRAIEEVLSFSLLSPNKLVVLDRVDTLKKSTLEKKEGLEKLVNFITHSHIDIPLVLLSSSKKVTSSMLLKALKPDQQVELKKTTPSQLREIIQKRLAKNNVKLDQDALTFFLEACGDDPESAVHEADKIILFADEGQTVTLEDCRRLVQSEAENEVWDLTNAVSANDAAKAVRSLKNLLDHGTHPLQLTGLLTTLFRKMYHYKTLKAEKATNDEITKRTGMRGWTLQNYQKQSNRFSLHSLETGLSLLKGADNDLKGGKPGSPESLKIMVMERLVIDLCYLGKNDEKI